MAVKITSTVKADPGWVAHRGSSGCAFPIVAWAVCEVLGGTDMEAVVVDASDSEVMVLSELIAARDLPADGWTFARC